MALHCTTCRGLRTSHLCPITQMSDCHAHAACLRRGLSFHCGTHLDCLFLFGSSAAKTCTVPWSLDTQMRDASGLKLMLQRNQRPLWSHVDAEKPPPQCHAAMGAGASSPGLLESHTATVSTTSLPSAARSALHGTRGSTLGSSFLWPPLHTTQGTPLALGGASCALEGASLGLGRPPPWLESPHRAPRAQALSASS